MRSHCSGKAEITEHQRSRAKGGWGGVWVTDGSEQAKGDGVLKCSAQQ